MSSLPSLKLTRALRLIFLRSLAIFPLISTIVRANRLPEVKIWREVFRHSAPVYNADNIWTGALLAWWIIQLFERSCLHELLQKAREDEHIDLDTRIKGCLEDCLSDVASDLLARFDAAPLMLEWICSLVRAASLSHPNHAQHNLTAKCLKAMAEYLANKAAGSAWCRPDVVWNILGGRPPLTSAILHEGSIRLPARSGVSEVRTSVLPLIAAATFAPRVLTAEVKAQFLVWLRLVCRDLETDASLSLMLQESHFPLPVWLSNLFALAEDLASTWEEIWHDARLSRLQARYDRVTSVTNQRNGCGARILIPIYCLLHADTNICPVDGRRRLLGVLQQSLSEMRFGMLPPVPGFWERLIGLMSVGAHRSQLLNRDDDLVQISYSIYRR